MGREPKLGIPGVLRSDKHTRQGSHNDTPGTQHIAPVASEKLPTAHCVHWSALPVAANSPGAHGSHGALPPGLALPAAHSWHDVEPRVSE